MKSSYCSVPSNYFTSFQAEIEAVLVQRADRHSFEASEVSHLCTFIFCAIIKAIRKRYGILKGKVLAPTLKQLF